VTSSERNYGAVEERFSLTVDQYGRLWLHTKLEGVEVAIDLAEKDIAFEIMATTMAEHGFDYRPVQEHDGADNDDEPRS
jgi:hypothetical protein